MTLDFPNNPSDGQIYTSESGLSFVFDAGLGAWLPRGGGTAVYVGLVPPADPFPGLLWWQTELGRLMVWYDDGDSQQWVPASPTVDLPVVAAPTFDEWNTAVSSAQGGTHPGGDTPMTSAMGTQIFDRQYEASDPKSEIEVDCTVYLGGSGQPVSGLCGLFIDDEINARAIGWFTANANWMGLARIHWRGVLSAGVHRYRVRFSGTSGIGLWTVGTDLGRYGGGTLRNTLAIREVGIGSKGPTGDKGPQGDPGIPGTPGGGEWNTGDVRLTLRQYPVTGWLKVDDSTIGPLGSGATRVGAEYWPLYAVLWALPGDLVVGGRGSSPDDDWNIAAKPIMLAKMLGRLLGIAGQGEGLTVAHALGAADGTEQHNHGGWVGTGNGFSNWAVGGGPVEAIGNSHQHVITADTHLPPASWLNAEIKL